MPLPKDMDKCMSKVKKEYPHGRSDKKKSKKAAHKQHVAMCMNAQESTITDMTFIQYLTEGMEVIDMLQDDDRFLELPRTQQALLKSKLMKMVRQGMEPTPDDVDELLDGMLSGRGIAMSRDEYDPFQDDDF